MAKKSYVGHWKAATWTLSTEIDEPRLKRARSEPFLCSLELGRLKRAEVALSELAFLHKRARSVQGPNFLLISTLYSLKRVVVALSECLIFKKQTESVAETY